MKATQPNAEKQTAKLLRLSSSEISERFISSTCQHDQWEEASKILSDIADNIPTPSSLRELADLLCQVADEAERLATDDEHEAHATESLCELVSENLMTKYDRHIGRA